MEIRELVKKAFQRDLSDPSALNDAFDSLRLLEPEDFTLAHERNKEVRRLSAKFATEQKSLRMFELNKRSLLFDAPYDFDAAIRYAEWDREPKRSFICHAESSCFRLFKLCSGYLNGRYAFWVLWLPRASGRPPLN